MGTLIVALDHVQLAMPAGKEALARSFYGALLGLEEIEKPPALAACGGVWFAAPDFQVHLGVEANFHPALKAHPCFRVTNLEELETRLHAAHMQVHHDVLLPAIQRFYTADPFGNRIEFQQD